MKRHLFAGAAALAAAFPLAAQDIKLPSTLTFTAYDTGTSGFNMVVAIGKMMKDKHGADMRVLPAGNDVARLAPVKAGRAQASAMGIGTYFAQEGVLEFAVREWGPQPLRLLLTATDCNALSLGVAKDAGVREVKDLRGKRIGMVVGSPALNQGALGIIAFGGLGRNDVKLVEFSSFGAMWKGMLNNDVDAAFASTITGQVKEVEASPRGILFPPTPASDREGWARLTKVAPYFAPHKASCGPGLSAQITAELPSYPYPIVMTYAAQPAELVHAVTRSMIVNYAGYRDAAPGAAGFAVERQNFTWVVPYHAGAVRALTEAGAWKAEHEAHNQRLLKRQDTLAAAWNAYLATNPPTDAEAFRKGWTATRADALRKAQMDVVFE